MKRNHFFYLAAAALSLSFAACSQDDITPGADNLIPADKETSYAKVRISLGSNFGTRAFNENDFDAGTKEEANVTSLALMLYDADDNLVGTGSSSDFSTSEDRTGKDNVSDKYDQTIVKITLKPGSAVPEKLLAYVNTDVDGSGYKADIVDRTKAAGIITSKGFAMTNSGYYAKEEEGGEDSWTIETKIGLEDLYDTAAEAKAASNAVTIYVERLAAKITVDTSSATNTTADAVIKDVDGNEYKIEFNAKKWAATGLAKEMFTLKQQFDYSLVGWANASSHSRSYWAEGVNYATEYGAYLTDSPLTYVSANHIVAKNGNGIAPDGKEADYAPEHTFGAKAKNGGESGVFVPVQTSTNAILVGKYEVSTAQDGQGDASRFDGTVDGAYDFYLAMTGTYFTIYSKADLIKRLFDRSEKEVATEPSAAEASSITLTDYFDVVKNDKGQYVLALSDKAKTNLYIKGETTPIANADGNLSHIFTAVSNAAHYLNGWAYFFIPMQHNNELEKTAVGYYGVVRNHSYQVTVNTITGLGAPLDEDMIGEDPENTEPDPEDPEEPGNTPIEPDPDDLKDAYIDATLNVLSWHNTKFGVDL